MSQTVAAYLLFLGKALTVLLVLAALIALVAAASRRGTPGERLEVTDLNRKYRVMQRALRRRLLPRRALRRLRRAERGQQRSRRKEGARRRVFVLDFRGDLRASGIAALREEITAALTVANAQDEIVVRLHNAGGTVHDHGLGAAQLLRVRRHGVRLTVAVDRVAASGGYMMACVADHLLCAPFAIIGSIGVLAQLPNFHELLERHGVAFEQIKAGELKRTLTMFGRNTDQDRGRLQEQVEDTHQLFKNFVAEQRPAVPIEQVTTGEYWYGTRALDLNLVDAIATSDEYLLAASEVADVYQLRWVTPKKLQFWLPALVQRALSRLAGGGAAAAQHASEQEPPFG